jgi:hypothetical protein
VPFQIFFTVAGFPLRELTFLNELCSDSLSHQYPTHKNKDVSVHVCLNYSLQAAESVTFL